MNFFFIKLELSKSFDYILDIGLQPKDILYKTTLVGMKGWRPFLFWRGFFNLQNYDLQNVFRKQF